MENKKPLLVAKDISISFGALKAVDNFNLEINSGELIGLIGPNGAGKTTVFNILTGVYNASSGEYTLDGENVIKTSTSILVKKGLARTFQNIRLFKYLSVLDNVVVFPAPLAPIIDTTSPSFISNEIPLRACILS